MSLVTKEKVVELEKLDFNKTTSNWLVKHGFKKVEQKSFSINYYEYSHKELPLKIRPTNNKERICFFGDYEISFCNIIYVDSFTGQGQESVFNNLGEGNNASTTLDIFAEKMSQAIALAKKFTKLVNKKEIK